MVKLTWTPQAAEDLNTIAEYIANDSVKFAKLQIRRIRNRARQLVNFPQSGRQVPELGQEEIREVIEGNYRIIYKIKSGHRIDILTVHHSSRTLTTERLK